ncbi:hypothetical protein [Paenarthrobacter nitroguajacolicus]|uniref:hypothetical protein n=1 Tax=Paenarthrobacter nitroguajacolicus TaxID=211146 RepID=UPI0015BB3FFE|nr:hypothetical protein [Paenarthrobacter nitroguajacolicus]
MITIITALSVPNARAVAIATLLNYPYALGAYVGALNGVTFFPRPPISSYEAVAHEQTLMLLVAFGLSLVFGIAQSFQKALAEGWAVFSKAGRNSVNSVHKRIQIVLWAGLLVGLHDAAFLATNLGAVLSSGRHSFKQEFWVGNGLLGIVLALVVGIVLVSVSITVSTYRFKALIVLGMFWGPSLIAGSRNYFSVLMVTALCAAFFTIKSGRQKLWLTLAAIIGISAFTWLPTLWTTNDLVGFNEWILPTSSLLPLSLGLYTAESLGATSIFHQWVLLLPGPFRPYPVTLYADEFAERKFTNVGVAGNPWSDSYDPDLFVRVAIFAVAFISVFLIAGLLRRVHIFMPFMAFGLMAFWGRSVFWNVVVILIYSAILLRLLIPMKSNDGLVS